MKRIYLLLIFLIPVFLGILFRAPIIGGLKGILYYSPCDYPIAYAIGKIDERFNITPEELLEDIQKAAAIWSNTQGKPLFVHDGASQFTINMVYDSRQALTSKITELNTDLKAKQGTIDPQITDFKRRQAEFEKRVSGLNAQIQYWNTRGGAPKDEYEKLIAEQKGLQGEAVQLNATARELGQSTDQYNLSAKQLNQTIGDYQTVLQNKPEEGLYEQDGKRRTISIYIDIDKDEFLHTLTHEMGHALSLNHNSAKESIMFPQTTSVLIPSANDTRELNEVCRKRTIFEVAYNRVVEVVGFLQKRMGK